jgi:hypothetical protein
MVRLHRQAPRKLVIRSHRRGRGDRTQSRPVIAMNRKCEENVDQSDHLLSPPRVWVIILQPVYVTNHILTLLWPWSMFLEVLGDTPTRLCSAAEHGGLKVMLWTCIQRCSLQISAWTSAILTEMFCGFPHSLQENAGIVSWLGSDHFICNSLVILPCNAT